MEKKTRLTLTDLQVRSFVTKENKAIEAGGTVFPCIPDDGPIEVPTLRLSNCSCTCLTNYPECDSDPYPICS